MPHHLLQTLPTSLLGFLAVFGTAALAQRASGAAVVGAAALANQASGVEDGDTEYTVCDATCQRDVAILEGFIIMTILSMALIVICCCMHCINTPTRFATPREQQRPHQD